MPPGLISHEFRTPLAAVVGLIRVLDRAFERLDESTRRDVIKDLVRDSSRLNNLIENMLLFAQAGSIEHVQEPVSLHPHPSGGRAKSEGPRPTTDTSPGTPGRRDRGARSCGTLNGF